MTQTEAKWWRDQTRNHLAIAMVPPIFGRVVKGMNRPDLSPGAWNPTGAEANWKWMDPPSAKAKAAGMSTEAYARQKARAKGALGRQARLAITLESFHHNRHPGLE